MLSVSLPVRFELSNFKVLTSQKTLFLAPRPAVALGEQTLRDLELPVIRELL